MSFFDKIETKLLKKEMLCLSLFALFFVVYSFFYKDNSRKYWIKLAAEKSNFIFDKKPIVNYKLQVFDPNLYEIEDWENIGFSIKQAKTIINFKNKFCKGEILSKSQLKQCFAITDKKFSEISPFLLLPDQISFTENNKLKNNEKKLQVYKSFNPNDFSLDDWQNIGLSEKQAAGMLKYKKFLGGEFHSKDEMANAYILKGKYYQQIKNYILLPNTWEKPNFQVKYQEKSNIELVNFDPNKYEKDDWMRIGFSEKQALGILNYKEKICKGKFINLEQLNACYMLKQRYDEIKKYVVFDDVSKVKILDDTKLNVSNWEINSLTYQDLILYGFNQNSASNLIFFRKALGGYQSKIQLKEAPNVNTELVEKLIKEVKLIKSGVNMFSLKTVDENILKQHPYFKFYADKILYFRQSNTTNESILKAAKIGTEAKIKMYWYLKD